MLLTVTVLTLCGAVAGISAVASRRGSTGRRNARTADANRAWAATWANHGRTAKDLVRAERGPVFLLHTEQVRPYTDEVNMAGPVTVACLWDYVGCRLRTLTGIRAAGFEAVELLRDDPRDDRPEVAALIARLEAEGFYGGVPSANPTWHRAEVVLFDPDVVDVVVADTAPNPSWTALPRHYADAAPAWARMKDGSPVPVSVPTAA